MKFSTKNLRTYLSLNELHVGVLNSFVSKIQKFRKFFFFWLEIVKNNNNKIVDQIINSLNLKTKERIVLFCR